MQSTVRILALAFFLCLFGFGARLASAASDEGLLLAQARQGGQQQGGQQQGQQQGGQQGGQVGNNPCVQSNQRCVMMCAGNGNCVNNCNNAFAMCMQQRGGQGGGS
jgi:hypothetical protein